MQMEIQCPHCGKLIVVNGIGRKRLNISVKNICDAVERHSTLSAAANELGCSRGYIYKTLKEVGLTVGGVRK